MVKILSEYERQLLVFFAKACRHDPWKKVRPLPGVPQFGDALQALVSCGYLERNGKKRSVRPTRLGFVIADKIIDERNEQRKRPIMYDPVI